MNGHGNQATDKCDRYGCTEHRRQCECQRGHATGHVSSDVKRIHEPHGSRKKHNPRTEELEWVPSAESSRHPKPHRDKRLQPQRDARRPRQTPTPQGETNPDRCEQEWKQIVMQVVLHFAG